PHGCEEPRGDLLVRRARRDELRDARLGGGQLAVPARTRGGAAELGRRAFQPERRAELLEERPRLLEPLRRESPPPGAAERVAECQQRAGAVEREADSLEPGDARLEGLDRPLELAPAEQQEPAAAGRRRRGPGVVERTRLLVETHDERLGLVEPADCDECLDRVRQKWRRRRLPEAHTLDELGQLLEALQRARVIAEREVEEA